MPERKAALVVIDIQNDYFPGGNYPLWNAGETLAAIERTVAAARARGVPVVLVQHVAGGPAPFFNPGTPGVEIHPRLLAAAPGAPVVVKAFADAFHKTTLDETLRGFGVDELLVCGMMTQNCVTHTAISRAADAYKVTVLPDCCATVDRMIHAIALNALSIRVALTPADAALGGG